LLTGVIPSVLGQDKRALHQRIAARFGKRRLADQVEEIVCDYNALQIERKLLTLRLYRPGRWRPAIKLLGQEHIDLALSRNRGVIIWDSDFAFASLITKMAMSQAGFSISHLSRPAHGFDSSSKYGMAVLNPLIWSIEKRFLGERIVLSGTGTAMATRTLMRRLKDNGIVSITANSNSTNCVCLPFLDSTADIAVGAPWMALKTGAALLPVYTYREPGGEYVVMVDRELEKPTVGSSEERINVLAGDYLERLTPYVEKHPGEWRSWYEL
jgi:lauroyl/myristoyl acyltransferase